jgi:hypothetical protein
VAVAAGDGRGLGVGWRSLELDRAALELAGELGLRPDVFLPADDSILLGARCRVATAVLPGGRSLAILEPVAEGRLAGTLARLGEGPAAVWSTSDASVTADVASTRPGPFGPERLVAGGPLHGPHRFLIASAPGTIAP